MPITYHDRLGQLITTTAAARGTYFDRPTAAAIFGDDPEMPVRWHREFAEPVPLAGLEILAVELVVVPHFVAPAQGVAILHFALGEDPVAGVASVRRIDYSVRREPHTDLVAELLDGAATFEHTYRPTMVTYLAFEGGLPPKPLGPAFESWPASEQWLYLLATGLSTEDHLLPDPEFGREPIVPLSSSWRAMVLRDGASFLALADPADDEFLASEQPATFVRSIYTDVLLLGVMQRLALGTISTQLAERPSDTTSSLELRRIETRLDTFRTSLWWQHITHHGIANDLLIAYQEQTRLQTLLLQVISDLNDSARLHALIEGERTADLLNVIAAVGLPATVVLAAAPVFFDHGLGGGLLALLFVAAFSGMALAALHLRRHSR